MIDFVESENSMGFHAPQEATRILGDAINQCRLGQLSLHGGPAPSHNPPNIENVAHSPGPAAAPAKQSRVNDKPTATVAELDSAPKKVRCGESSWRLFLKVSAENRKL